MLGTSVRGTPDLVSITRYDDHYPAATVFAVTEDQLIHVAEKLGASAAGGPLSQAERAVLDRVRSSPPPLLASSLNEIADSIELGLDPLGSALIALRPQSTRRREGTFYTPSDITKPMVRWLLASKPERLVDAGSGSGRFALAAACADQRMAVLAVDRDPVATLLSRASASVLGVRNLEVVNADYLFAAVPKFQGMTAFVANPPYVRHHLLSQSEKLWGQMVARARGHTISGLAGLHAYFFLATAVHGQPGDIGSFVTSAEWLDVNYGRIVRELLLRDLGALSIDIIKPTSQPFDGVATTAVITCFEIGSNRKTISFRQVDSRESLSALGSGEPVAKDRLAEASRWTQFVRARKLMPDGYVELGEICRVHRGAVTGSNATWVTDGKIDLPRRVLFPSVTRARELFAAGESLDSTDSLRRVIDIPEDLDVLESEERRRVESYLEQAKRAGAADGYIARYRRAWWSVGLRAAAPILATYMARRSPAFVRNMVDARHINIAHGLYPRVDLPDYALDRLAAALRGFSSVSYGRTYAGGLTKFEPREMERLPVPDLDTLLAK